MKDKTVNDMIDNNEKMKEMKQTVDNMRANLPLFISHMALSATLHRAKYLALKEEGFNDQEALELCKKLF